MKLQVIVSDEFLKLIDDFCTKFGYQRSEFIRNCIRSEIFSQTNESLGVSRAETGPIITGIFEKVKPTITQRIKDTKSLRKNLAIIPGNCHHGAAFGNCKYGCRPGKEVK